MTRDEKNRKIAEWLGWQVVPDFYASEEASALLLEKLVTAGVGAADRKTAIAEAALKLIETLGAKD